MRTLGKSDLNARAEKHFGKSFLIPIPKRPGNCEKGFEISLDLQTFFSPVTFWIWLAAFFSERSCRGFKYSAVVRFAFSDLLLASLLATRRTLPELSRTCDETAVSEWPFARVSDGAAG